MPSLTEDAALLIAGRLAKVMRPRDVVIASIHWGPNWGYDIANGQMRLAHTLIESSGVSIVHGQSSHHPKAIEVFNDSLILYGCGDFLNDYEGISAQEAFRSDLVLMYFADVDVDSGALRALEMTPLAIQRLQLARPSAADAEWLRRTLDRESKRFGVRVTRTAAGRLAAARADKSF